MRSIAAILKSYSVLLEFLEELGNQNDANAPVARGLLSQFEKGSVYFGILLCRSIFEPTEELARALQGPQISLAGSIEAALNVVHFLDNRKSQEHFELMWDNLYTKLEQFNLIEPTLPKARKVTSRYAESIESIKIFESAKDLHRYVYNQAHQMIIEEINRRFNQPDIQEYEKLERLILQPLLDEDSLVSFCQIYEFDFQKLKCQLCMIHQTFPHQSTTMELVENFRSLLPETKSMFSEVSKLFKLLLVVPASAERSFSLLRRIKTYLRSTMTE